MFLFLFLPLPEKGGYAFRFVCLFVCLFVCPIGLGLLKKFWTDFDESGIRIQEFFKEYNYIADLLNRCYSLGGTVAALVSARFAVSQRV